MPYVSGYHSAAFLVEPHVGIVRIVQQLPVFDPGGFYALLVGVGDAAVYA